MKALKAVYLANAREFLRDRSSLLFVLLPVAFATFFGLLFGGGSSPFSLEAAGDQVAGTVASSRALRAVDFCMPHLLGMALLWLGLFGTAAPLVEQREAQVLRRLGVTPLSSNRLLAARLPWRLTEGLLQTALLLLVGYLGFGVGVAGNPPLFAAGVSPGALVVIGMGYLPAGLASS